MKHLSGYSIALLAMAAFAWTAHSAELALAIVDVESGAPINQARVEIVIDGSQSRLVTGANGLGAIPLPEAGVEYDVTLTVEADGYVPALVRWDVAEHEIPGEFTIRLEKGTTISARVEYEDGTPISDATVSLFVEGDRTGIVQPAITDLRTTTDAAGRWQSDVMPRNLARLQVRVTPPGDSRTRSLLFMDGGERDVATLRDGTAVIEIARRYAISGVVKSADGSPVEGARLTAWTVEQTASSGMLTTSNADGAFEFQNCPEARMMIATEAEGLGPDITAITPGPDAVPLEIVLPAGDTIQGRVTNARGEPIQGVYASPHTWRGQRMLAAQLETDQDGRFVWNSAPPDEDVVFSFRKPGYAGIYELALAPGATEHPISMNEVLRVSGAVTDAETGTPLDAFLVYQGIYFEQMNETQWGNVASDEGYQGEYELYIEEGVPAVQVRIEADGYLPAQSEIFVAENGFQRWDVQLKKGSGPKGVVRDANGNPAIGVDVFMAATDAIIALKDGKPEDASIRTVKTDSGGRFEFPPVLPEFRLAAYGKAGYAVEQFKVDDASFDLALEPLGRVEGEARIGDALAPYERVQVESGEAIKLTVSTVTDPDGRFKFEGVPPGAARIEFLRMIEGRQIPSHGKHVEVASADTTQVRLGGDGRAVIGRVGADDDMLTTANLAVAGSYAITTKPLPLPVPESVGAQDQEAMQAWYSEWQHSPEGRAHLAAQRSFAVALNRDGTFYVDDIPAGAYQIAWRFYQSDGKQLGNVVHEFEVPETDPGAKRTPIELGSLPLTLAKQLRVGDEAPPFEALTLDGAPVRLTDFRGKYVLLDFWATWCGPCIGETPYLVEVFDAFGDDTRFAMIGLSLDDDTAAPKKYTTDNAMDWVQCFVGDRTANRVLDDYGVEGIPSIMLVGPDGKIVATDLRGPDIKDAVAKAIR